MVYLNQSTPYLMGLLYIQVLDKFIKLLNGGEKIFKNQFQCVIYLLLII